MEHWQVEAARIGGASLAQVLTEMRDAQRQMIVVVEGLKARDEQAHSSIESMIAGFPAGDFDGHRRYHESVIEWRELRNRLVREALINAAKVGTWGALSWLAWAAWKAFVMTVKQ